MRKATPQHGFAPPLRTVSNAVELDNACHDIRINETSLKQLRVVSVSDGPHWLRMKGALKRNTSLEELELLRTRVESKGLEDICPVLGQLRSFKSFVICEDYSIYKYGWKSIADMMTASKSLEFVSVWAPSHSIRACIEECTRGVAESSSSLKTFELHHHADVDLRELQPLIDVLEASPHIERFYLPKIAGGRPLALDKAESKHGDVTPAPTDESVSVAESEAKAQAHTQPQSGDKVPAVAEDSGNKESVAALTVVRASNEEETVNESVKDLQEGNVVVE